MTDHIKFPVASFYQKTDNLRQRQRKRRLEHFQDGCSTKKRSSSLLGPSQEYRVFQKQCDALEFAQARELMVFSFELNSSGQRNFVACHPSRMWEEHVARKESERHTYEVIAEGTPCKLYFDLEFMKKVNPGRDSPSLLIKFVDFVLDELQSVFGVACDRTNVIDLDSSTPDKFSHHLIFNLPGGVFFRNNFDVGEFVRGVCRKIETINDSDLKVKTGGTPEEEEVFVDRAVYSKNRNFRLYLSSKFGKRHALRLSDISVFARPPSPRDVFLESLVSFHPDLSPSIYRLLTLGSQPSNVNCTVKPRTAQQPRREPSALQSSPFIEVDNFIKGLVSPSGTVRKCTLLPVGSLEVRSLIYEIAGHRYCRNVGREHRSNNVKYVVHLEEGVAVQRCHDPDCKDFSSDPIPLPPSAMPWRQMDEWNDQDQDYLDDGMDHHFLSLLDED